MDESNVDQAEGTSRRTVLKTAAHAAWVVPSVQLAAASPAFAASGNLTITAINTAWVSNIAGFYLDFDITVRNDANVTTSGLNITITFPAAYGAVRFSILGGNVGAGWGNGTLSGRTFTFPLTAAQLAPGASSTLNTQNRIHVPTNPAGAGPAITIVASSGGGIGSDSDVAMPS